MKRALFLAVVFAFIMSVSAYAVELPKPIDKLITGTTEVVKSPFAIYDHTKAEIDSADYFAFGLVKGLVVSPFHMAQDAGHGILKMATFPID